MFLSAAFAVACSWMAFATDTTVKIEGGVVSGTAAGGVRVFKGIPYAAPPVGDLRWKPPQPVVPWHGVPDGSAYAAECPQTQYPAGSIYIRPLQPQSDDCPFLTPVTTPNTLARPPVPLPFPSRPSPA